MVGNLRLREYNDGTLSLVKPYLSTGPDPLGYHLVHLYLILSIVQHGILYSAADLRVRKLVLAPRLLFKQNMEQ